MPSGGWDDLRRESFSEDSLETDVRVSVRAPFNGDKCTGSSAEEIGPGVEISRRETIIRTFWVAGLIELALSQSLAKTYNCRMTWCWSSTLHVVGGPSMFWSPLSVDICWDYPRSAAAEAAFEPHLSAAEWTWILVTRDVLERMVLIVFYDDQTIEQSSRFYFRESCGAGRRSWQILTTTRQRSW